MKGCVLNFAEDQEYQEEADRQAFLDGLESSGVIIHQPKANELFIDTDTEEDFQEFMSRISMFDHLTGALENLSTRPSKSGLPNRHTVVTLLCKPTPPMMLAMQAVFNSDPMREFLAVCRAIKGEPRVNVLFEYPEGYNNQERRDVGHD